MASMIVCTGKVSADTEFVKEQDIAYSVDGGNIYFNEEKACVSGADTGVTNVVIPERINGIEVKTIGHNSFENCENLVSIKLADTITRIDTSAFEGCRNLTDVDLSNSLESISGMAFTKCSSIKKIVFPASLEDITNTLDGYIFVACSSLESIEVDERNTRYASEDGVLYDEVKKKIVRYPENKAGTSYEIKMGTSEINQYAFRDCKNLKDVKIPNSVRKLGLWCFYGCKNIQKIEIPEGVTTLEGGEFNNCTNLESIIFPESLNSIMTSNCCSCPALKEIKVAESNPQFCDVDGILFSKDMSTLYCYPAGKSATSYKIPDSVELVSYEAFDSCHNLKQIDMGNSVKKIYSAAFRYCTGLEKINLSNELTLLGSFTDCDALKSIKIPDKITKLESWMFVSCNNLERVYLPENIKIEDNAFIYCDKVAFYGTPGSAAELYAVQNDIPFRDISQIQNYKVKFNQSSFRFNGKQQKPKISVEDLAEGRDYTVTYPQYSIHSGTYTIEINGIGNYKGTKKVYYKILPMQVTKFTLKGLYDRYAYSGKYINPSPQVIVAGKYLRKNTDYKITYSNGRKYVGVYTLKITLRGDYSGQITKKYTIVPKKTLISQIIAGKKSILVKWKMQREQVTGYQIYYSTSKYFTKSATKSVYVKGYKNSAKKFNYLKAKKRYYVKVRTYKTIKKNGDLIKIYSGWSKPRTIVTK